MSSRTVCPVSLPGSICAWCGTKMGQSPFTDGVSWICEPCFQAEVRSQNKVAMSSKTKKLYNPRTISFEEWREFMREFISTNGASGAAWDVMTALRGPDTPTERSGMGSAEFSKAYAARVSRKFKTVEVIRAVAFYGSVGGCAKRHTDDKVVVPAWDDHFNRHVRRAAARLGLNVEVEK